MSTTPGTPTGPEGKKPTNPPTTPPVRPTPAAEPINE